MKKWSMIALAALCLALPVRGGAQELPQLFEAVGEGLLEGLEAGGKMASASLGEDLTLALHVSAERMEAGDALTLTIEAGNPRAAQTPVKVELQIPERLAADGETVFEAVLPPAQIDEETGALAPSVTTFERKLALASGDTSETVQIACEMSMGTRFYRAGTELALCMPDVSVSAQALGTDAGRLRPGDSFTYRIEAVNAGAAGKEIELEMTLPEGMALCGALPQGLHAAGGRIAGSVFAAAAQEEPSVCAVDLPVRISPELLDGDEDAQAVLGGVLRADGERIAVPKVQAVAPRVSARLIPQADSLAAGETMDMEILVLNTGLAPSQVEVTCLLPAALELAAPAKDKDGRATQAEADREDKPDEEKQKKDAPVTSRLPGGPGGTSGAAVVAQEEKPPVEMRRENGAIVYALQMDAAQQGEKGVQASSVTIPLRVRAKANETQEEQLVGASLLCSADGDAGSMSEAVAIRVYNRGFLGLSGGEWNAIFWAALLMLATVFCLYAATRPSKKDEYVFD